jgi:putative isomerase
VRALHAAGRDAAANDVAGRLVRTLAADIAANGTIHEFYHAETGQPLLSPGFLSWNMLAHGLWTGGSAHE